MLANKHRAKLTVSVRGHNQVKSYSFMPAFHPALQHGNEGKSLAHLLQSHNITVNSIIRSLICIYQDLSNTWMCRSVDLETVKPLIHKLLFMGM